MTTSRAVCSDHSECVAQAAAHILSVTCGTTIEPLDEAEALASGDVIVGIISLVGDIEWSVFFGIPKSTAVAACGKFAGFEILFDSPDMDDAVGELTNMLAGQVKLYLDQQGVAAEISLPTVIRAETMTVLLRQQNSVDRRYFICELGRFWTGVMASDRAA